VKMNDFEISREGQYGVTIVVKDGEERWTFEFLSNMCDYEDCELACDWEHLKANGDKEWGEV